MTGPSCPKCEKGGTGPHPNWCTRAMRFWRKVKRMPSGCWEWQGARSGSQGYGIMRLSKKRKVYSHRWSYEQVWGEVPKGRVVMHLCDNPACVRPAHLMAGTQYDNLHDAYRKGRMTRWGNLA